MSRSCLYVPGDSDSKLERALALGADAVIVDLEDAIAPSAKEDARMRVATWLEGLDGGVPVWVRINVGELGRRDVEVLVGRTLIGFVVPKAQDPAEVRALSASIGTLELARGVPEGSVQLALLVETAEGVLRSAEMARLERVSRLQLGEADLCAETGIVPGDDEVELVAVRTQVVLASSAARIDPPVGPVYRDVGDLDGLRRSSQALRRIGFAGRSVIHPAQVETVNAVFSLDPAEVARAAALLEQFERVARAGTGVFIDDRGQMVDEAVVRAARNLLRRAGSSYT